MAFTWPLTDGTTYEFPHAKETGRLKAAVRKTRDIEDEYKHSASFIEVLLGKEGPDIDAYDLVEDDVAFMKEFFGGLVPKD